MRAAAAVLVVASACVSSTTTAPITAPASASVPAVRPPSSLPAGVTRPPHRSEQLLIGQLMRETEALRGLRFRAPVTVRIQDPVAIRSYVRSALEEEDLERARLRYLALGLIDPALDVRELIESLMEEELIGYYDPKAKVLVLRNDVADALSAEGPDPRTEQWRATVVHELVHALQDQQLGLSESLHAKRTTDEENAFGALVEGDATLTMLAYMAARQGSSLDAVVAAPDELRAALHGNPERLAGRMAQAPALVREPLLFRYREGAVFSARLYRSGGWSSLNEAHRSPPHTTFRVNTRNLLTSEDRFQLTAPPSLSRHGCAARDDDSLGALEVASALAPAHLDASMQAWRGDRYVVLQCATTTASVWVLRFSSAAAARRARLAFEQLDAAAGRSGLRTLLLRGPILLAALSVPQLALQELQAFLEQMAELDAPLVDG